MRYEGFSEIAGSLEKGQEMAGSRLRMDVEQAVWKEAGAVVGGS